MEINQLPALDDYWKLDKFFHYSPIADCVSRNRFCEINRYLHFVDNSSLPKRGEPNYNRLGKICPSLEHFNRKFLESYNPTRDVAIDEAMIAFQGRSSMKQYLPLKPVKRGFKVWIRVGYFQEFDVYTGRTDGEVDVGLAGNVVLKLTRHITDKYHHVYFDNFFSSPKLLNILLAKKTYACGTVRRSRRGYPNDLKGKKNQIRRMLGLTER